MREGAIFDRVFDENVARSTSILRELIIFEILAVLPVPGRMARDADGPEIEGAIMRSIAIPMMNVQTFAAEV